jgi:HPt (histidine-containing phosphotransfer) domain-containing protein
MNIAEEYNKNGKTPDSARLFDLSIVKQLCRGNEQNLLKMILVFVNTISASMEEMKIGHGKADSASLQRIAHRIRPALALYSVAGVEKDMLRIELEELDIDELGLLIKKVDMVINDVVTELKKEYLIA